MKITWTEYGHKYRKEENREVDFYVPTPTLVGELKKRIPCGYCLFPKDMAGECVNDCIWKHIGKPDLFKDKL